MAFFSTIFVVLFSMMASQNFSSGTHKEPEETPPIVTKTPDPYEENVVPNDEDDIIAEESKLTNNQKYFEALTNPNSTSILLLGTDPTGFNFDTITILNVDKSTQKVKLISLPRDIYIDYSDEVIEALRKSNPSYLKEKGMHRINAVPSIGNTIKYNEGKGRFGRPYVDFLADIIYEVFDIYINDFVYVKVKGFRNIVDYFGGVTVYVPNLMNYNDPYQDLEIYIEKGTHTLYGKDAEGYVRFRQGFDEEGNFINYGDIYRKNNQNRFIKAFISQHVTLKNLGRLKEISNVISSNIVTSVKGWNAIVDYAALAEEALVNKYPIENVKLSFKDKMIDGSSYVVLKEK
jgi:LCP family protein required for cell wall assembly